jgi:hypothetical protein
VFVCIYTLQRCPSHLFDQFSTFQLYFCAFIFVLGRLLLETYPLFGCFDSIVTPSQFDHKRKKKIPIALPKNILTILFAIPPKIIGAYTYHFPLSSSRNPSGQYKSYLLQANHSYIGLKSYPTGWIIKIKLKLASSFQNLSSQHHRYGLFGWLGIMPRSEGLLPHAMITLAN